MEQPPRRACDRSHRNKHPVGVTKAWRTGCCRKSTAEQRFHADDLLRRKAAFIGDGVAALVRDQELALDFGKTVEELRQESQQDIGADNSGEPAVCRYRRSMRHHEAGAECIEIDRRPEGVPLRVLGGRRHREDVVLEEIQYSFRQSALCQNSFAG